MRLGGSLLLLALTAGFAVLAVAGARLETGAIDDTTAQDVDAWFV
jgi:hypothetical protein